MLIFNVLTISHLLFRKNIVSIDYFWFKVVFS